MSSLSSILSIAQSGLQVAQTGLDTVSNNVANVNTAGYVKEVVNQSSTTANGVGTGVTVDGIVRATNAYLEKANLSAQSDAGSASISSSLLSQAQSLFGDPSGDSSFFSQLDDVFSAFSSVAASANSASQTAAVDQTAQFFSSAQSLSSGLQGLSDQADQQIDGDVTTVNGLLSQISDLNTQISQANVGGQDATGAQNQQSALISQLSSLLNVTATTSSTGAVTLRAADGTVLADSRGAATLSYSTAGPTGQLSITPYGQTAQSASGAVTSGELSGLVSLRNVQLPGIADQVAELVSQTAKQLNAVSNSYASVPAPTTLTGANTGTNLATDINNFTGTTNIAVVNSAGVVQSQLQIAFNGAGGIITAGSSAPVRGSPATFLATLNGALGASGSASFANGALSISATGGNGVVVSDDAGDPSLKAGQGFSAFFGLNNLVSSGTVTNYDTGLTASDPSGYPAGQSITLRLSAADGSTLKDVTVTTPTGGTVGDLVSSLNSSAGGVGAYGAFNLDANGELTFQPAASSGVSLSVVSDDTSSTAAGVSLTELFGIGDAQRIAAANSYALRPDIVADPGLIQTSAVDLSGGVGSTAIAAGDTSGADALAQAGGVKVAFDAAGGRAATSTSLSNYASELSGDLATRSSSAATAATDASALASEAQSRLSGAEGVNIDAELVSLTTYQQAYNASARLIQAAKDMFDTLLSITGP